MVCPDCELAIVEGEETICAKCLLRRSERKEIITEIVETEGKYGRDLRIIVEEFYRFVSLIWMGLNFPLQADACGGPALLRPACQHLPQRGAAHTGERRNV